MLYKHKQIFIDLVKLKEILSKTMIVHNVRCKSNETNWCRCYYNSLDHLNIVRSLLNRVSKVVTRRHLTNTVSSFSINYQNILFERQNHGCYNFFIRSFCFLWKFSG